MADVGFTSINKWMPIRLGWNTQEICSAAHTQYQFLSYECILRCGYYFLAPSSALRIISPLGISKKPSVVAASVPVFTQFNTSELITLEPSMKPTIITEKNTTSSVAARFPRRLGM